MSTNDLTGMAVGEARYTVLTSAIARMVDVLWVLNRAETALYLTGAGRAPLVRRWLGGYIFYNDKVKFEDATAELGQFGLAARAAEMAKRWPRRCCPAENRFLDSGDDRLAPARWLARVTSSRPPRRSRHGRRPGAVPAGEQAYQWLRLAAGQPEVRSWHAAGRDSPTTTSRSKPTCGRSI
jgi:folate-binding Fe-S cluster repair protein YgfZ